MNKQEIEFIGKYQELIPDLNAWGELVDDVLLETVLSEMREEIKILPKHRLKEQRSLIDKAFYRQQNYKHPLSEIVDKVGTRVVFLKSDDVVVAKELIMSSPRWQAVLTKDVDQEIEDKPKVFDYQSIHVVVYPNEDSGFHEPGLFGCEIQLRTLLQHAFAEVSHDNVFKGVYQNDPFVLRQLAKSMALMEATDDYFKRIYEIMTDDTRIYPAFLNDLAQIYKEFVPTYTKDKLNVSFNDKFLVLFQESPVAIQEIRTLIEKRLVEFKRAIKISNGYLFQQPVSILIGYYLLRQEKFLTENWPVDRHVLKEVYRAFNQSETSY